MPWSRSLFGIGYDIKVGGPIRERVPCGAARGEDFYDKWGGKATGRACLEGRSAKEGSLPHTLARM